MPRFLCLHGRALRMTFTLLLSLALAGTLISCGLGVWTQTLFGGTVDLKVQVEDTANDNNPVAVDVLLVSDEDLLKQLLKMPAREWFDKQGQIKRDFPEGMVYCPGPGSGSPASTSRRRCSPSSRGPGPW